MYIVHTSFCIGKVCDMHFTIGIHLFTVSRNGCWSQIGQTLQFIQKLDKFQLITKM